MYDVTKIISAIKGKRGDHRVFRLAENLCLNLIFSLRDFFLVKREGKVLALVSELEVLFFFIFQLFFFHLSILVVTENKTDVFLFFPSCELFYFLNYLQGPTEFTETLNRVTVITLAILIKTRGIADAEHLLYLQNMLEQIMATSHHTWSEKTLHHFPSVLREALSGQTDKRSLAIQTWQQVCYTNCIIILKACLQIKSNRHMMELNFGFIMPNCFIFKKKIRGRGQGVVGRQD